MADGPPHAHGRLKAYVERIERLEEDKKAVTGDLGEVYAEAKGEGFDTKVLKKVIRRRAIDPAKLAEEEAMIDLYEAALGGRPLPSRERPNPDEPPLPFDKPADDPAAEAEPPTPAPPPPRARLSRGRAHQGRSSGKSWRADHQQPLPRRHAQPARLGRGLVPRERH